MKLRILISLSVIAVCFAPGSSYAQPTTLASAAVLSDFSDLIPSAEQIDSISERDLTANQEAVQSLAERIRTSGGSALSGLVVNAVTLDIWTWWNPRVPEEVLQMQTGDVRVHTAVAEYTRAELESASRQLFAVLNGNSADMPYSVSINGDGSGITVSGESAPQAAEYSLAIATIGIDASDVAVTEAPTSEPYAMRQDATSMGGAGGVPTWSTGWRYCSTAFAVLNGANGFLLSAGHCDTTGNLLWKTGNKAATLTPGGSYVSVSLAADSLLMNATGGTSGRVFVGGIQSVTTLPVSGTGANNIGDTVCTSGANSGEHCNLVIVNDALSVQCVAGYTYPCTMIRAAQQNGGVAIAHGDSGGPVYVKNATSVVARGVISQGDPNAPSCFNQTYTGSAYGLFPTCSSYVDYMPIRVLETVWGVQVERG